MGVLRAFWGCDGEDLVWAPTLCAGSGSQCDRGGARYFPLWAHVADVMGFGLVWATAAVLMCGKSYKSVSF